MKALILALMLLIQPDLYFEIEDEREARNEELRSPDHASPLTAVDQVMIEEGGYALLYLCADKVQLKQSAGCGPIAEIQFDAGKFLALPMRRTKGIWGPNTPFTRELSITPGKSDIRGRLLLTEPESASGYTLFFSLQGGAGRVMLHNTRTEALALFEGLNYFDIDLQYHYVVKIDRDPQQGTIEMATTQGLQKKFRRLGTVAFETPQGRRKLSVFSPVDSPQQLFIPFRDATNGEGSYAMGRYLYLQQGPTPATYTLDFNRAFNPYCAYSAQYNCPYPPKENHLDIPIPAGEKLLKADEY